MNWSTSRRLSWLLLRCSCCGCSLLISSCLWIDLDDVVLLLEEVWAGGTSSFTVHPFPFCCSTTAVHKWKRDTGQLRGKGSKEWNGLKLPHYLFRLWLFNTYDSPRQSLTVLVLLALVWLIRWEKPPSSWLKYLQVGFKFSVRSRRSATSRGFDFEEMHRNSSSSRDTTTTVPSTQLWFVNSSPRNNTIDDVWLTRASCSVICEFLAYFFWLSTHSCTV